MGYNHSSKCAKCVYPSSKVRNSERKRTNMNRFSLEQPQYDVLSTRTSLREIRIADGASAIVQTPYKGMQQLFEREIQECAETYIGKGIQEVSTDEFVAMITHPLFRFASTFLIVAYKTNESTSFNPIVTADPDVYAILKEDIAALR